MGNEPQRSVNTNYYSDAVIDRAFNLQEHIKEEGLDGVHYSLTAKSSMEFTAEDHIETEVEKQFKKNGLDVL